MGFAGLFGVKRHARKNAASPGRENPPGATGRPFHPAQKVLCEPLEPRLLLSADPFTFVALPDTAVQLTLRLVDVAGIPTLQLLSKTGAVVASKGLAGTSLVEILGSDLDDHLTIDLSRWFSIPIGFHGRSQSPGGGGCATRDRWMALLEAEENQRLARLELQRAMAGLGLRTIRSPIIGVVVKRFLSPGEFAGEAPLLRLAQLDPLRVEVFAPVSLLGQISVGMSAQVLPEAPI